MKHRPIMKALILLLLPAALFLNSCCEQPPAIQAFYSDGSVVDDTTHLYLLKRELPQILKENKIRANGIKVYTSLRANVNEELAQLLGPLQDSIYATIDWERSSDPEMRRDVERFRCSGDFFDAAVVAIDNRTGQIVTYFSTDAGQESDGVSSPTTIGGMRKTFAYALAMQKEYDVMDRYPQIDPATDLPDTTINAPFYFTFSRIAGTIRYGLDQRYNALDRDAFLRQLGIRHDGKESLISGFDADISLLDMTKTYYAFYNDGLLNHPSVVDSIVDRNGKTVYKRPHDFRRVLDEETANEMMQLLDCYTRCGAGLPLTYRYTDTPDFLGNYAGLPSSWNGSGWLMTIQGDYTIGVRNFIRKRRLRTRPAGSPRAIQQMTVPFWLKTINLLRQDGQTVPDLEHYYQALYKEKPIRMDVEL